MDTPTPKTAPLPEEYLTISEVADRLKVKPKTVRNKMASGVFREGVHYFSPEGMRPRFKWDAVVAWMEQGKVRASQAEEDGIPMARGYKLGIPGD
jgi:excisionase family DNA binding protein